MKTSRRARARGRVFPRILITAALIGSSLVGFASTANAAGGEQGVLLLKGPGSLYAGPNALASLSVAAGTAASFGFEVKNTGPTTAQFNIQVSFAGDTCSSPCPPTTSVTTGSLVVTPLTAGPNGYFTAPIAPGAVATYTLKITPSKTGAVPGDSMVYDLQLADTAGTSLGLASRAWVNVTRSKGTTAADEFVSASGTPANSGKDQTTFGAATAPSVAVGKPFSFTVKLMNDSPSPAAINYELYEDQQCQAYFPITVTEPLGVGSTVNVTSAVNNGTFTTATLAPGGSVSLTVKGTSLAGGAQCLQTHNSGDTADWFGITNPSGTDWRVGYLIFSPAAN